MLGERGVFFSILWGLRQGECEAEHWEVQQLNSVHCATEPGPGGHGVQHSSGALSIHPSAAALWEGGGGGGALLHYQIRIIAYLQECSLSTTGDKSPVLHCLQRLMKSVQVCHSYCP